MATTRSGLPPLPHRRNRRRQMRAFLRYGFIALLGVVLLSSLPWLLVALFVNVGTVRASVESAVLQMTGRTLTFGTITMLRTLPPTFAAQDVRLANLPGGARPEMLKIPYAEATLRMVPLLFGRLDVTSLVLSRPDLVLETGPSGLGNWQFQPIAAAAPATRSPIRRMRWVRREAARARAPAVLERLSVREGTIAWRAGGEAWSNLEVHRLDAASSGMQGPGVLTAQLGRGGVVVALALKTGPLERVRDAVAAPRSWPVALTLATPGGHFGVSGTFDDPRHLGGYRLALEGAADNLADLGPLLQRPLPPLSGVVFRARLADSGGTLPDVSGISLRARDSDLDAWVPGLRIDAFELAAESLAQPVRAEVGGRFAGQTLRLTAALGPPAALLVPGASPGRFPLRLTAEAGGGLLDIDGAIAAPESGTGLRLAATAKIPDLSVLSPLVGRRLPASRNVTLSLRATDGDGGFRKAVAFRDVAFSAAEAEFGATADLVFGAPPAARATVQGRKLDLDALRAGLPPAPAPAAATGWLIPADRLNFDLLDGYALDLSAHLDRLRLLGLDISDAAASVQVRDGRLLVDGLAASLPDGAAGGRVSGRFALNARAAQPPITLAATMTGVPADPVVAALGLPAGLTGTLDVAGELRSAGASWRDIVGNLTGHAGVVLNGGEVGPALLDAVFGPALRLAGVRQPARPVVARCLAVRLDAERGIAGLHDFVLAAPPLLLLQGDGAVQLRDERLSFQLVARDGTAAPAVPVRISGLFANLQAAAGQGAGEAPAPSARADPCADPMALARAAAPRR